MQQMFFIVFKDTPPKIYIRGQEFDPEVTRKIMKEQDRFFERLEREEIAKTAKEFFLRYEGKYGTINEAGWLVVEPISDMLNLLGHKNRAYPYHSKNEKLPNAVYVIEFENGSKFVPQGADLKQIYHDAKNWMWI